MAVCLLWSAVSSLSTAFCARFCGQNTWLPRPCRHVNRAASDASVSLSPASSPGHVSSFLLHALRLRGRTCIRMRLTKEEFHGNRLLWLAAVDKLIESFGEVCVLPLPSDAGHRLFPSVPFREGERRRQKTTLTEQKYSRQREREAERRELEYQTCFAQAQIDLAFHTPATVGSWLSRWSGVVEEHDLETIFWGWCGRFPSLSSFDRFFWQEEPLWRLIFEAGEAGRGAPVQVRALEQWMIPNKLENAI